MKVFKGLEESVAFEKLSIVRTLFWLMIGVIL